MGNLLLAASTSGLQGADYLVILAYLVGIVVAGWYFSRQQEKEEDYFLAGRRMPWLAVGLSVAATMLSTVTYLAAPGEVIQHGLALSIGWFAIVPSFFVVNFVWIPFIMRLRVISIYEYLERRFGLVARWTAVALFLLILRTFWMATIVVTAGRAVALITHESITRVLPWNLTLDQWTLTVLLSVGVFATLYTMLGGIKAVIWTDVLQFLALFAGVVLTLIYVALDTGTGPIDWWHATTEAGHDWPPLASWDITTRNTILFTVLNASFWYCCTFIGDQVAVQRYLSTPSVGAAVRGNIVNFVADLVIMVLLAVCGMALLSYYLDPQFQTEIVKGISDPRNPEVADKAFPHFIAHGLPVGVSGLVVAALFAVAMSSLDSGINSVAAVLTVDVFDRLNPERSPGSELRLARIISLVVGLACTALALALLYIPEHYNIIGITTRTFNCALGPLAAMFVAGMFLRYVGEPAVVVAALAGLLIAIGAAWWVELLWLVGATDHATLEEAVKNMSGPSPFLVTPIAATSSFLIAALLGLVFRAPDRHVPTWWSVVRGPDADPA